MNKDDEKWIKWRGGKCPVPHGTWVYYKLRSCDKDVNLGPVKSNFLRWNHDGSWGDLIAYKIKD